jgi:Phytanoyl-CoA dioxygenase (PhyH)
MVKQADISLQLHKKGYALLDAGLVSEVAELNGFVNQNYPVPPGVFYYSLMGNSYDENISIRTFIKQILGNFYNTFFENFYTRNESFLSKPRNIDTELLLHQDWSYTDEKKFSSYNIWIPLTDVTANSGAMFFLPGSHLWLNNIRSSTLPTARLASTEFNNNDFETIEIKAGQALIFNPAVFHGSYPNHTNFDRTVITATIFDKDAPYYYYQKTETDGLVKVFTLDDNTYMKDLDKLSYGADPLHIAEHTIQYNHATVTAELLKKFMKKEKAFA